MQKMLVTLPRFPFQGVLVGKRDFHAAPDTCDQLNIIRNLQEDGHWSEIFRSPFQLLELNLTFQKLFIKPFKKAFTDSSDNVFSGWKMLI